MILDQAMVSKMVAMVSIVVVSMAMATIPHLMTVLAGKWECLGLSRRLLAVINCVTTGFYLGLSLHYFLAYANYYMDQFKFQTDIEVSFPILESSVSAGFVMVAVIDAFVHHRAHIIIVDLASASSSSNSQRGHVQRVNVISPTLQKMVTILSLSVQTLLAGLALGLQNTSSEVTSLALATTLYASLVSFDLGHKLFTIYHAARVKAVCWSLIFALSGPIGISFGITITEVRGLSSRNNTFALLSSLLMAFASGSFLHVTFINYTRLKVPHKAAYNGFLRLLFMVCGLLVVSCLKASSSPVGEDFVEAVMALGK